MSIETLYDFLTDATPDYDYTLVVDPQDVMYISGEKEIEIHRGRGRQAEERIILSDESKFWVKLQWRFLSDADHATLFGVYHDPTKACGTARTFYWTPPTQYDSHTYVVRFDCRWESFLQNYKNYGVTSLIFAVLGRKPD